MTNQSHLLYVLPIVLTIVADQTTSRLSLRAPFIFKEKSEVQNIAIHWSVF